MCIGVNILCIILYILVSILQSGYFVDGYLAGVRVTPRELTSFEFELPLPELSPGPIGFNMTIPPTCEYLIITEV